jgi:hypothetical protein
MAGTSSRAMWNSGRLWLIAVLILSAPAWLFVLLHLSYARWPEFLGLPLAWALALAGSFGCLTTIAAVIVAVVASFQRSVSGTIKVALWAFVALSVFGCWYIAQVPS